MIDSRRLLDQFLGANPTGQGVPDGQGSAGGVLDRVQSYAKDNPLLTGGVAGGLAGLLLGGGLGRGIGEDVVKYGGMALIGGLAYKAYRDWQGSKGEAAASTAPARQAQPTPMIPPPSDSAFAPANAPQGETALAEAMIVAMIAAAKADGKIDAEERGRIYERLEQDGLTPEEVAFLQREMQAPLDIERIVKAATTKEAAVELYAASLMAVTPDTSAEQGYLSMLAGRLGLEPDLAISIENAVRQRPSSS